MNVSDCIDRRLLSLLECPRDQTKLTIEDGHLCCTHGHKYPVVDGIPVFILVEKEQTIGIATASQRAAESGIGGPLYVDTLDLSEEEKRRVQRDWVAGRKIDPAISYLIGATSGRGYVNLIGRLQHYPIPDIPVGNADGKLLLDVGCSWGRWSVSAVRKGWRVVGIDPSIGAILAARRAFSDKRLDIAYVCGDARYLPFKANLFQCAFSYSVIQHFSETDAEIVIGQLGRVLCQGGAAKIQMAHSGGLRSMYSSARRDYMNSGSFRVRYWSLASMRKVFEKNIGLSILMAEGFGGLGLLVEDRAYMSGKVKVLIAVSMFMKKLSVFVAPLIRFADSVYVVAIKR
jgi:SAM-dependent methyltransferase/uncharacterized protein YbaR (Trm112 family)